VRLPGIPQGITEYQQDHDEMAPTETIIILQELSPNQEGVNLHVSHGTVIECDRDLAAHNAHESCNLFAIPNGRKQAETAPQEGGRLHGDGSSRAEPGRAEPRENRRAAHLDEIDVPELNANIRPM
jgi:hypothetical protein